MVTAQPSAPELARLAGHLADPSRAAMLMALMDGRAWTVGELAGQAGIARNTASEHLSRLADAGLVTHTRQGRHSYLSLAGEHIANLIESLGIVADTRPATSSLRGQRYDQELARGRTCYRHLAGRLGVDLVDSWLTADILTSAWDLTSAGLEWFRTRDIPIPAGKDPLLRPCVDWTERRPHAAGPLANSLAATAFEQGWIVRGHHPRAARLTSRGGAILQLNGPDRPGCRQA